VRSVGQRHAGRGAPATIFDQSTSRRSGGMPAWSLADAAPRCRPADHRRRPQTNALASQPRGAEAEHATSCPKGVTGIMGLSVPASPSGLRGGQEGESRLRMRLWQPSPTLPRSGGGGALCRGEQKPLIAPPQLQRRQTGERQHDRDDPEAGSRSAASVQRAARNGGAACHLNTRCR